MLQDFLAFLFFVCVTIFSWIVSYSDFEELLLCYGCHQIEPEYDFVIVGGGTAGCALARRLAENSSATILILEAGGRGNRLLSIPFAGIMLQQSNFDWKYTTTRQTGACLSMDKQKCKFPLGKMLGGSHQLNNMLYTRGHPSDFDAWFKDLPGYNYEKDVEEYFNRAEQLYSENESVTTSNSPSLLTPSRHLSILSSILSTVYNKNGYRISPPTQKFFGGFYRPMVTQKNGRRWTTSDHLLEMNFPNVEILTKARAEKIVMRDKSEAVGIKFNYLGDNMFVKARRAVVLSSGTVGSAKLLMLSGIGPRKHLHDMKIKVVQDLPVGNNLQDHLTTGFDLLHFNESIGTTLRQMLHPKAGIDYLFSGKGPWTTGGVDLVGFTNLEFMHCKNQIWKNVTLCDETFSRNRPDIEFMLLPLGITADNGVYLKSLLGITDETWDKYYAEIVDYSASLLPVLLHPESRGTVRLANKNPNSKPLINPNYLSHPNDVKVLLSFIIQFRKCFDLPSKEGGFGYKFHLYERPFPGCERHEFATICYWECYLRHLSTTCYHPVGTCKMGVTEDTVVDYDFRVHGTHKLFVVDGSVFPSQVSGHIMGPIIMMAERAAEYLKKYYGLEHKSKLSPKTVS